VTEFEKGSKSHLLSANNVWIGEAQGNQGTDIDLGPEGVRELQRDLLNGTPFQGITGHYFVVSSWLEGLMDLS
jgi:hypothetical protein